MGKPVFVWEEIHDTFESLLVWDGKRELRCPVSLMTLDIFWRSHFLCTVVAGLLEKGREDTVRLIPVI